MQSQDQLSYSPHILYEPHRSSRRTLLSSRRTARRVFDALGGPHQYI